VTRGSGGAWSGESEASSQESESRMRKAEGRNLESKYKKAITGGPAPARAGNGPGMPVRRRRVGEGAQDSQPQKKKSVYF